MSEFAPEAGAITGCATTTGGCEQAASDDAIAPTRLNCLKGRIFFMALMISCHPEPQAKDLGPVAEIVAAFSFDVQNKVSFRYGYG